MALEDLTGTKYIDALNSSNPTATDAKNQGDDHLRGIKNVLLLSFPSITGAVTATHVEINQLDGNVFTTDILVGSSLPGSADGTLHVHSGSAGAVTANAQADDLIVENSVSGGISILTPSTTAGAVYFGDEADNRAGIMVYSHTANQFSWYANNETTAQATLTSTGNGGGVLTLLGDASGTEGGQINLQVAGGGSNYSIDVSSSNLRFLSGATENVRIPQGGGIGIRDGITAPSTVSGMAFIYVDTADGDLKVKFGDGTVKTIVTDT